MPVKRDSSQRNTSGRWMPDVMVVEARDKKLGPLKSPFGTEEVI
jgi:hypothetical protein